MSTRSPFARQSLVPILGFIAVALFIVNFFTFLSHRLAPSPRCTVAVVHDATHDGEHLVHLRALRSDLHQLQQEMDVEVDVRALREAEREVRRAAREAAEAERSIRLPLR